MILDTRFSILEAEKDMIGKSISHYEIVEKLGTGGMGVVYKAHDTKLKRTVALKFLPTQLSSDPEAKERFIHEAQAASALDHPNICTIYEIGETKPVPGEPGDGESYIAMACYDGISLRDRIAGVGDVGARCTVPLPIDDAINITIQIAQGLHKAHEKGIVHRDIKPVNIMITAEGTAKILDFGLAKLVGQTRLTKTGSTLGTFAYMSPEQARGEEVDHRTDIWSLGVILYEMMTGELPFKGDYDQAVVYSILNEQAESLNSIPPELNDIIETMLAKNPDERYQEIDQMLTDLKVIKGESDSSQKMISHRFRSSGRRLSKLRRYVLYPLILIVVLLIGYFTVQTLISKEIEPVPIAVISFENQTGDPAYDYLQKVIPNLLITDLEQSKFFHVNTWERMKDLLEQAGEEDREFIDVDVGIQLAKMDNIPAIVTGSIIKIGEMFSIDVKVLDTDTKEILKSARSVGEGENSILRSQIDDLTEQIATVIDLPEREFAKTKRPLIEVTTNSLEAYKYYLSGRENLFAFYIKEARDDFAKALLLDSTFAMAHIFLAYVYWQGDFFKERDAHLELAKKYRDKVTHKEQILLDLHYATVKGIDVSKSISAAKKGISLYPKEKEILFTSH